MIEELELINPQLLDRLENTGKHIGRTPLFKLKGLADKPDVQIFAKLEWQQLGGSVKARPAYNIIKDAILNGILGNGRRLLDASSGNTAIAYAAVGAALGVPVTICLPENASEERKLQLKSFGAEIIYTSKFGGTDDAQEKAKELYREKPDLYYYADQYGNDNNWKAHYLHTANEIISQTNGKVTHFIAGLGTSGTFMGTGRRLKEYNKDVRLISQQPETAMHGLEGWKHMETAIVPGIYEPALADGSMEADTEEAHQYIIKASREEGLLLSPSAGANMAGAYKLAAKLDKGVIVTVFADSADKYGEVLKNLF
ncbi:PLP-dependent cysteine synthase family protein [Roseivirga sp. BDSF3-8]|uniref:PLP-dependent cysteine synthase family protein n=1 Tax=Roseivirga sp. BDSF3-8 TaxID=3241598 RepID=UPI003531F300